MRRCAIHIHVYFTLLQTRDSDKLTSDGLVSVKSGEPGTDEGNKWQVDEPHKEPSTEV